MTTDNSKDAETPTPHAADQADLGFGRVVAQAVRGRFLSRDGLPTSRKYGLGAQRAERFYLSALNARWPTFLGWLAGGLLLLNGCFALAYLPRPGQRGVAGTRGTGAWRSIPARLQL